MFTRYKSVHNIQGVQGTLANNRIFTEVNYSPLQEFVLLYAAETIVTSVLLKTLL